MRSKAEQISERMKKTRIVPVIALEHAADASDLCRALQKGGLEVAEITFRTAAAAEALSLVNRDFPDFMLGAGTVTTPQEVDKAKAAGAQFAVSPGLNPRIVKAAGEAGLPFFPGVCTPSDIEAALELGCSLLKFFPAEAAGGVKAIKAIYGPYRHRGIQFIPTGGISAANMVEYLSTPGVLAIGGSWIVAKQLIQSKDWDAVARLTREAVETVRKL